MNIITSTNNQKIKDLVNLKKSGERKKKGLIIIDGTREIELAKKAGIEILELYYCPNLIKKPANTFFGLKTDIITEVSESVFNKICYKDSPGGYLAVAKVEKQKLKNIKLSKNPLIVVLEAVEKPGNLGAIIRTAYAAGVDLIIINDGQTDIYNPNVIRASEGFVFNKTIVITTTEETLKWLSDNKILSYAAATGVKNSYTKEKMDGPLAVVLGSEANGLSEKWLKKADKLVKIPMAKGIDSLNVSVSAALLIYEARRQRGE